MILILDDHPLARQGLCSLIQMQCPEEEILQAGTVRQAKELAAQNPLDMVFVDLHLKGESGFDFVSWVREQGMTLKIFIITSSSRLEDFQTARHLGVSAYVLKDAFLDEIIYGLKVVEQGGRFYSSALVEKSDQAMESHAGLACLTDREQEVFELISKGLSNSEISRILYISEGTTKKHITNIFSKLHLKNRVEAILYAVKSGTQAGGPQPRS